MQRMLAVAISLSAGLSACVAESVQRPIGYGPPGLQPARSESSEDQRSDGPPGLQPARPESSEDQTICTEETPTGSNITRTVCRTKAEAQQEGDAGRAWSERNPANPYNHAPDDPFKRVHP